LPDNRAVVTWFSYPPEGEAGSQAWMIGNGAIDGSRIMFDEMLRPVGAVFGPDFNPNSVVRQAWGTLELTFLDCNTATAAWSGPEGFGDGGMDLARLSQIDDVECDAGTVAEPDRVISGRSGAWYDPAHDGEGWMLEMLGDGRMVVYWFTYDDQGRQAWMIGEATVAGKTLWVENLFVTGGARFGDAFRKDDVVLERWGSLGFHFDDCSQGTVRYASSDERFGEGALKPVQLAQLASTSCDEPEPVAPLVGGTWRLSTETDVAVTETASAAAAGFVYTGGGYRHLIRFQRFDPLSGSYTEMPELPDHRHHPMMTSDGRDIFLAGGYTSNFSDEVPGRNLWRFDTAASAWEILPDMPRTRAAGAAVYLHGRIFVVGGEGPGSEMQSYDIRTGEWTLYPGDAGMIFDHMQAVVFENEIWWMGGRTDRTFGRVLIWNPVTLEWRDGPPLIFPRAGFAAKVVQGQIFVVGGEVLDSLSLVRTTEVFAPGADAWVLGQSPPVAVHGTTGSSLNGNFVLTAGSEIAGRLGENRATQIFLPAE
jgi:hypothetical protein